MGRTPEKSGRGLPVWAGPWVVAALLAAAVPAHAGWDGARPLDLSWAANRGFADEKSGDGVGGWTDQGPEGDLHDFPVGDRTFVGVPFHVIDPAKNDGRSVVALCGRPRPSWPEAVTIRAGGSKASYLYFLHTAAWAGTDKNQAFAQYVVRYGDGSQETIPLRVGVETAGWWGPGRGDRCLVAWTAKRKAASVGVQVFEWKNPRPGEGIEAIVFRSLRRMPVPLLLAVTESEKRIALGRPPEEAVAPEGAAWAPAPPASAPRPPVDFSRVSLRPAATPSRSAKKKTTGLVSASRGGFVDPSGERIRFLGFTLPEGAASWDEAAREKTAAWAEVHGFNLVELPLPAADRVSWAASFSAWRRSAVSHHLYLALSVPAPGEGDAASREGGFWSAASPEGVAPGEDPVVAWITLEADSPEAAARYRQELTAAGARVPISARPGGEGDDDPSVEPSLDFGEGEASWDEPVREGDGIDSFSNQSLLTAPESGILVRLSSARLPGRPFVARVGEGWPNGYAVEGPAFFAVMGAFQGWDALLVRTPWGRWDDEGPAATPASALWPAVSLLFRRGDVAPAKLTASVGAALREGDLASSLAWWSHALRGGRGAAGAPAARIDPKLKKVVADNGRWEWQANIGVFRAGSPRSQVLAGFLSNRPLGNYAWDVQSPNPFAVFILSSLTDDATALSRRLMVTAVARYEREGARFNPSRTALLAPGGGAILWERVRAKVTIVRSKADPTLAAAAYDAAGHALKKTVPLVWRRKSVAFSWPEGAVWVLLESGSKK